MTAPRETAPAVSAKGTIALSVTGSVATITFGRPGKLNTLTPEMLEELEQTCAQVRTCGARVLVVRAIADKVFCAGADIERFAALKPAEMYRGWTTRGHRAFSALAGVPQPTLAVVHGHAFGGGLELALACDFRIVAEGARLAFPEVGLGTVPGWGGSERLTTLIGPARAKEMILARRHVDATTALDWGLATRITAPDDIEAAVDELVGSLLGGAPLAIEAAKQLVDAAAAGAPSSVLEPLAGGLTAATHDLAEGIAAFRERRAPNFSGQ